MPSVPNYFYLNGKLHEKLAVIRSDSKVLAFCFQDEERVYLPLIPTIKHHKKAFSIPVAAKLMRVSSAKIKHLFQVGLYPQPECSYNLNNMRPKRAYINEDDMLKIRQILWDLLPKNRYGVPHNDTMTSEEELIHAMRSEDERDYVRVEDDMIRIYRA